jgi:P-type E1-E2 ATPase
MRVIFHILSQLSLRRATMQETIIEIPNYKTIKLIHIVLDYNGTIAKDGILKDEVKIILPKLTTRFKVHVITADTFGSVNRELKGFDVCVKTLKSDNHTLEKANYVQSLNATNCAAIGNGNNDMQMIELAEIGISIIGDEGCSTKSMMKSDLICKSINDALELFLNTKRLIATLRE